MASDNSISKRDLLRYSAALVAAGPLGTTSNDARADDDAQLRALLQRQTRLPGNVLYINADIVGSNSVLGFRRATDGSLTPLSGSPYNTGGSGFFIANPGLGPFDGDQEVVIDRLRGVLYAVNAGSNSVAAMKINDNGALTPLPGSPFATPGINPVSLGLHLDNLVVLNADQDPTQSAGNHPSVSVAAITNLNGRLRGVSSTLTTLPDGSGPTQALTTNTGPFTFTCDFLGGDIRSYVSFALGSEAILYQLDVKVPPQQAGAASVPKPLGLSASPNAPVLYVGFATTDQIGVYSWDDFGRLTFLRTTPVTGAAPCWLRTGFEGRRLYAIETGNNSISVLDTSDPANPAEIQNLLVGGLAGRLVQFEITPDNRFLYVIERASTTAVAAAQGTRLEVFAIDAASGLLSRVEAATLQLPVPTDTNPLGVAIL